MVSAICPNCHILLVEANSADEAIATSNPVQHSDLGASVDTAVNLGATEVSNSYGSAGPEPDSDLLRPLLRPSRRRDHGGHRRLRLRDCLARNLSLRDRGRRDGARQGPDDGARLERDGLGQRLPRRPAERGAGHRQRLLDVGAEAGVAARRRLRQPHGRRRLGGRRRRRDLRQLARGRRLGRRRRHEHRHAGHRERLRARRQREVRCYGSYPYSHQSSLFDVTQGSNFTPSSVCGYLCTAEPGYDGPTGLGTPNGIGGF